MAGPIVLNIQIIASKSEWLANSPKYTNHGIKIRMAGPIVPKYTNHGIKIRMAGPIVLNIQIIASKSEWLS